MKKLLIGLLIIGTVVITAFGVPNTIQYKGRLMENETLVNGAKTMSFKIYDSSTGDTVLWSTGNMTINIVQGVYSVDLGDDNNPLPPIALSGGLAYLQITIDGFALVPRTKIGSVAYALQAGAVTGESNIFTSTGNVGIGTTAPSQKLDVVGGINASGTVSATAFTGDGSALTGVSATGIADNAVTSVKISDGSIANADVSANAAITFSKLNITKSDIVGLGIPTADTDTQLSEGEVDSYVANNGYLTSYTDTGWDHIASQNIVLGSKYLSGDGGDEGVFVSLNGNVGIGTTAPAEKLDVAGRIKATSAEITGTTYQKGDLDLWGYNIRSATNVGIGLDSSPSPLYVSANNKAAMVVSQNGNVGIGTANPQNLLHIVAQYPYIQYTDTDGGSIWTAGINGGGYGYNIREGNYDPRLIIKEGGNVGIGTTAPSTKLDVAGTVSASAFVGDGSGLNNLTGVSAAYGANASAGVNSPNAVYITATGNVGIGTTAPNKLFQVVDTGTVSLYNGTVWASNYVYSNGGNGFFSNYQIGNNLEGGYFSLWSNQQEQVRIDPSGNVGIGTTNPTGKLEISGSNDTKLYINSQSDASGYAGTYFRSASDSFTGGFVKDLSDGSMQI
ncbi:MAG: hypothetical protein ABIH39_01855, partial [Candidatus Margulisiibacteriota bacterium]